MWDIKISGIFDIFNDSNLWENPSQQSTAIKESTKKEVVVRETLTPFPEVPKHLIFTSILCPH